MQYMLIYAETAEEFGKRNHPEHAGPHLAAWGAYMGAMGQAGLIVSGNGLQPPHTAATLRINNGQRHVQDGPFADAKEQLAGYVIIDVADLDTALDWAAKAPCLPNGAVEVRPVLPPMHATA